MTEPLIETQNLKQYFPINRGLIARLLNPIEDQWVKAVDNVSLSINEGEAFGLAGESGCGKTTLGKTILRLLNPTDGEIYFDGNEITEISGGDLLSFRRQAQIVHQDPYQSLNPRFTVYNWVKEPLDIHGIGTHEEREARVLRTLEMSGLKPAEAYASEYTNELSGGERQRVGIARAIILGPKFIVADEPASMLDVSIRASILDTFQDLRENLGLTSMYISHDLSLLKHMCDRIGIMYLGELVEVGPAEKIINDPKHPYTKALVSSVPRIDADASSDEFELIGEVPDSTDMPPGCRFHPRCPQAIEGECDQGSIPTVTIEEGHTAKCVLYDDAIEVE